MLAKITAKGQTTIPRAVRARLGLRPGDHLMVWLEGDRMVARRAELREENEHRLRRPPGADDEMIERIFLGLDALKRHASRILEAPDDEIIQSFATRHLVDIGRAARGVSDGRRSVSRPMLPWQCLLDLPSAPLSPAEARRWIRDELDLTHGLLHAYFSIVPMTRYLDPSGSPEATETG